MKLIQKKCVKLASLLIILTVVSTGCICKYPNAIPNIQGSLLTVQTFYDALVAKFLSDKTNATVHVAVKAADDALRLAGALAKQWCPDPALALKAEKMAADAKAKADAAGVK